MRIAVLADAHVNLLALDGVPADLRAQRPDLVSVPFDSAAHLDWIKGLP